MRGWDGQDIANTDLHWGAGFGFCRVLDRRDMTKRTLDKVADQELTFLHRIGAIPNRFGDRPNQRWVEDTSDRFHALSE